MKLGEALALCSCGNLYTFGTVKEGPGGKWEPDSANGQTPYCRCGRLGHIIRIEELILIENAAPPRTGRRKFKGIPPDDLGNEFDEPDRWH